VCEEQVKNKKRLGWKHGNTPRRFFIALCVSVVPVDRNVKIPPKYSCFVQIANCHRIDLLFMIASVIVYLCVRSKLKIKSVWGGNTATLPGAF